MTARLIVNTEPGGSRVTLIGAGGKPLMSSPILADPRAKGATVRSLKGMLGGNVIVEDPTTVRRRTG